MLQHCYNVCTVSISERTWLARSQPRFVALDLSRQSHNKRSSARTQGVFTGVAWGGTGDLRDCVNPSNGQVIGRIQQGTAEEYEACVSAMMSAQKAWHSVVVCPSLHAYNIDKFSDTHHSRPHLVGLTRKRWYCQWDWQRDEKEDWSARYSI